MKKMRRLIPAIAMLLVSAVMLSTASFAWFTISTEAQATGMTVSAKASSSLLIVNASEGSDSAETKFLNSTGIATFTGKGTNLQPATHDAGQLGTDTASGDAVKSPSGLVYITNTDDVIDPSTGAVKAGSTATWAAGVAGTHFKDYTVYLGAAGADMTGKLTATVTCDADTIAQIHNAIAIDFIVGVEDGDADTATTMTYVTNGTAWLEKAKADGGQEIVLGDSVTIPQALETKEGATTATATGKYYVVTMRVYFDGDYKGVSTTGNYVRDAYANTAEFGFVVDFKVS